ncbi:CPXCG motif-containing cysteine-rich protein [Sunxiuqinia indica]|uniref:CPXCG motif-containing cysteine-rich protein n=1 Tax=Sunxiuqinia indica TaxID=2692584 RepID=UPI00135BEC87|nr:CPXCG motif-containing cysteine-rich protein [Sunxiuqinia indica]
MESIETHTIQCPYCWQNIPVTIDRSQGESELTEDCPVCCNPVLIKIQIGPGGEIDVQAQPENPG